MTRGRPGSGLTLNEHFMRILESVLYAEDLEAAHRFYTGILGLEVISFDPARNLFMRCGDSVLILFKASETLKPTAGIPPHGTTGKGHLAFAATSEKIDAWNRLLTAEGIETTEKTWPNAARSLYFEDPAGNILEFVMPSSWDMT